MCDDSAVMLRDYLLTVAAVTDEVGDHVYTDGNAPDGPQVFGVLCDEIDANRESREHMRVALVQVTVFSTDKQWNRQVAGVVLSHLKRFAGYMGTTWVTVSHENETETTEQIGAVYRWAYAVDLTLRYK